MAETDILLEKISVGGALRVTAVCAHTGIEVVFIAPTHATPRSIDQLAFAKLQRAKAGASDEGAGKLAARRGVVV